MEFRLDIVCLWNVHLAPPSFEHGRCRKLRLRNFKNFVNVLLAHAENLASRGINMMSYFLGLFFVCYWKSSISKNGISKFEQ